MTSFQSPEITVYGQDPYAQPDYSQPEWVPPPHQTAPSIISRKPVPYSTLDTPISSKDQYDSNSPKEPSVEGPPAYHKWEITWRSPALCLVSYVSGVALAVGNHVWFTQLDGNPYENFVWIGRYSLAMALLIKTCFATCILICYEQVVWMGLKNKERGTSIRAIDALFGSTYQIVSLFYPSMWIQHPVAAIMIALRWLLPIMSIVSPTTLTVQSRGSTIFQDCMVPTVNISAAEIGVANHTQDGIYYSDLAQTEYTYNSWSATNLGTKIGTLTGFLGEPVRSRSPCGSNCSYAITYNAPLWRCTDVDPRDPEAPWEKDNSTVAPWSTKLLDQGYVYTSIYHYLAQRSNTTGKIWIGHLVRKQVIPENRTSFWDSWDTETFTCDGYNASISLRQQFLHGEQQNPIVQNIEYGNLVNWTIGKQWGYENNVSFADIGRHQTVYDILSNLFEGTYNYESRAGKIFTSGTSVLNMPAFVRPNSINDGNGPNDEIKPVIRDLAEQLSLNYSMSLLAYPELVTTQMIPSNCSITTFSNLWRYEQQNLIIAYCLGTAASLIALILGGLALAKNGIVSEISFSQVLATTRNSDLDKMMQGNCLGRSDLKPRKVYKERIRLGELKEQDAALVASGAAHAAFGRPETVTAIRRQGYYI